MSNSKKQMVAGFMFDMGMGHVVLIRKNKPVWQAGKHNGVGGKVEDSDASHHHAMSREFREETGLATDPADWLHYGRMEGPDWVVELFAIRWMSHTLPVKSMTSEVVGTFSLERLSMVDDSLLNDVMWMIHAARFALYPRGPKWVEANYEDLAPDAFESAALARGLRFPSRAWDDAYADWRASGSGTSPGDVPT